MWVCDTLPPSNTHKERQNTTMITVDLKDWRDLEDTLGKLSKRVIPFANRNMLNDAAFLARKISLKNIDDDMVLRNKWTARNLQVDRAKSLRAPEAVVGHTLSYMADQEFGGTKVKKGKKGVAIPTRFASNESEGSQSRQKLPVRNKQLKNIKLQSGKIRTHVGRGRFKKPKSKKQEVYVRMLDAVKRKRRFFYYENGRTEGIFQVKGGRLGKKGVSLKGARLKMVYDLSRPIVRIPRNPWLHPAVKEVVIQMPAMYAKRLEEQLKRLEARRI